MSRAWTGGPGGGQRDGDSKRAFSSAALPSCVPPSLPHRAHLGRATVGRQPGGKAEGRERMEVGLCLPLGPISRGRLGPSASARGPHGRARPWSLGCAGMDPRTCCGPGCWSAGSKPGAARGPSPMLCPRLSRPRLLLAAQLVQAQGAASVSQGRRQQGGRGINV